MGVPRPATYLNWTDGAPTKVVQPPSNFLLQGWQAGQAPPFQYMNWVLYEADQWIQYLDELTNTGFPDQSMRLLNGGTWAFHATSGVLSWSAAFNIAIPGAPDSANQVPAGNATLSDGEIAYVDLNAPVYAQGDTDGTTAAITNMNFTGNISAGDLVTGPGVTPGTTVLGVGPSSVTLSAPTTAAEVQQTYSFVAQGPLSVQVAVSADFIPTTDTILIARRSGAVMYVGVNATQMVMYDGEFKPFMGSGYFDVYQAPAGQNLTAGQTVYISAGSSDDGRTAGALYPLDTSAANQAARGVLAGVVISSYTTGQSAYVLFNGFYAFSGLVPGTTYYADPTTPGGITGTEPSGAGQKIVPVGFAVTATNLLVNGEPGTVGPQSFPVFFDGIVGYTDPGRTTFALPGQPLQDSAMFVYIDGGIIPRLDTAGNTIWAVVSGQLVFTTAPGGGEREVYVEGVLAQQGYLAADSCTPAGLRNNSNRVFTLTGRPVTQAATRVWIDGEILTPDQWTLTLGAGNSSVTINTPAPPTPSTDIYVGWFQPGTNAGAVSGAVNLGAGVGVFSSVVATVAQFKSIVNGSGTTVVDNGNGTIQLNVTGGSGPDIHGSQASPIAVDPTVGLAPTAAMLQTWWIIPTSGTGAVPFSGTQIAPGVTVGQRLTVMGPAQSATRWFQLLNGNGLDMPGDFALNYQQALVFDWNGTNWFLISNRF